MFCKLIQKTKNHTNNFTTFITFFTILFTFINIIYTLFLHIYKKKNKKIYTINPSKIKKNINNKTNTKQNNNPKSKPKIQLNNLSNINSQNKNKYYTPQKSQKIKPKTLKKILININFYLLINIFNYTSSIKLIYLNNLTIISKTIHLNHKNQNLILIIPITNTLINITINFTSNFFQKKIQQIIILIFSYFLYINLTILTILLNNNYTTLYFTTFFYKLKTKII